MVQREWGRSREKQEHFSQKIKWKKDSFYWPLFTRLQQQTEKRWKRWRDEQFTCWLRSVFFIHFCHLFASWARKPYVPHSCTRSSRRLFYIFVIFSVHPLRTKFMCVYMVAVLLATATCLTFRNNFVHIYLINARNILHVAACYCSQSTNQPSDEDWVVKNHE